MIRARFGVGRSGPMCALALACVLATAAGAKDAFADSVFLAPARDSTLIEDPSGALANGSGEAIFSGRINSTSGSIRRALLAFDVASVVPAGSTVTGVRLRLNLSGTSSGPASIRLYRVLAGWGEGASASGGGAGAPAMPGDSTWIHRFYDQIFWTRPGGDFESIPRGETVVDQPGPYAWGSTAGMVADVQAWLDQPESALGWILLGDETRPQTVKRFDSRESPEPANRPLLEVDFVPLCSPDPAGPGYWRQQCAGLPGDAPAGRGRTRDSSELDPGFAERILPCANRVLSDLGLPGLDACGALLSSPPACEDRASRKLAALVFNVCAGRLQTSCPVESAEDDCSATTVGDLILEISILVREGDCRRAAGCGGNGD